MVPVPQDVQDLPEQPEAKPSAWTAFWRTVVRFDALQLKPWVALRNALGVAIPLVIGQAAGHLVGGVLVSTGALNVAFSDGSDPYKPRALRMLASSLLGGLAVLVGTLIGGHFWLAVLIATCWAFCGGILVAVSAAAADIGVISIVVLVVFIARPMDPPTAALSALAVLCGGLLQTLLAVLLWPLRRHEPVRRALGDLYRELAQAASLPATARQAPLASKQSTEAQQSLASVGRDHSVASDRYRSLLSQAERIRLCILMLDRLRQRLRFEDKQNEPSDIISRFLETASRILDVVSTTLLTGKHSASTVDWLHSLDNFTAELRKDEAHASFSVRAMTRDAAAQMDALAGQLRAAADLASNSTPTGSLAFEKREASRPWRLRLSGTFATLRANLHFRSAAFRHAVRLAVCLAMGASIGHAFGINRSYWLPMTIAIVLKPDFTATFSRGVLRLGGTFLGLGLATALFHVIPGGVMPQVVLVALFMYLLRWVGPANYGIFVMAVSALVVLMVALAGIEPGEVIAARGVNTLIGGVLALSAYSVWPTWERTLIGETLAAMLDAYRDYFRAVADAYVHPGAASTARIAKTRTAARLARTNVQASVDRLSAEPRVTAQQLDTMNGMLASTHRFIHAVMSLEAGLLQSALAPAQPAFRTFANNVDLTIYLLGSALRNPRRSLLSPPDLRAYHKALLQSEEGSAEQYTLLNVETDRITNSLNTFRVQTERWIGMLKK